MKLLFAVPSLPRGSVSVAAFLQGTVPVSGSVGSIILVADALARRGHSVGLWVRSGQTLADTPVENLGSLEEGLSRDPDRIVLASWDDAATLTALSRAGVAPLLWTHVDVSRTTLLQLEAGVLDGLVVVSDSARVPLLHSSSHRRLGRVYNALNPFFAGQVAAAPGRYASRTAVFAGYFGHSKGAHLVLTMWPDVRRRVEDARLVMAGSAKLYSGEAKIGPLGLAHPDFEARYLRPIVAEFGSLEQAGITVTGLLTPGQLRDLYASAALGLVNFNWRMETETFCCVGAEMLACRLPIFGFAAGALPETMGPTGGAVLHPTPDLGAAAGVVAGLLRDPDALQRLGAAGRDYVVREYDVEKITGVWEELLRADSRSLDRLAGAWRDRRRPRYWLERAVGTAGAGGAYRTFLDALKGRRGRAGS
jgi:hypothetical protein